MSNMQDHIGQSSNEYGRAVTDSPWVRYSRGEIDYAEAVRLDKLTGREPAQPVPAQVHVNVERPRKEKPVKQSRDRAQYVRQQKGHSLMLHILFGALVLWIPAIYYSCSPNHYWHA
jgi:hypothetical protein